MNKDTIKAKEKTLVAHAKALEPAFGALNAIVRLLEIYDSKDEIVKSALFTSAIVEYGRAFKANKRKGKSEIYKIKALKSKIAFDQNTHQELLDIRDQFIAHQDWDVTGRALVRMVAQGEVNNTPFKFIAEQSVVIMSLVGTSKKRLSKWQKHVESVCDGLFILAQEVLVELRKIGIANPELFSGEKLLTQYDAGTFSFSNKQATTIPSIRQFPIPENILEEGKKVIGGDYLYRYMRMSMKADEKKINEGQANEITLKLTRRKVRCSKELPAK